MRKTERETNIKDAYKILEEAPYITIACIDEEQRPYAVTVSGVCDREANCLYFHCALEGKKLTCMKVQPKVCVSAVSRSDIMAAAQTVDYASCIIEGTAEIINDTVEKHHALRILCEKFTPDHMNCVNSISEAGLIKTGIVKIHIRTITGKENKRVKKLQVRMNELEKPILE